MLQVTLLGVNLLDEKLVCNNTLGAEDERNDCNGGEFILVLNLDFINKIDRVHLRKCFLGKG